jgi:hypothetical protein
MVSDLSEDMGIAKWFDRKKDYIKRMRANYDVNVINIMLADKLHNLISNYDNFLKYSIDNANAVDASKNSQTADEKLYSIICVRFVPNEITGLYSEKVFLMVQCLILKLSTAEIFTRMKKMFLFMVCVSKVTLVCN